MKFLKIFGIILALLLVGYLILCATASPKLSFTQSTTIDAPASSAYAQVANLKNWPEWSPWYGRDPQMENTYEGPEGGVGQINSWISKTEGNGSQEIIEAVPNKSMKTKLQFEGFEGANYAEFVFNEKDGKTEASWSMDGAEFPFLFRGMATLMGFEGMVKKDYDDGLAAIKKAAEAMPKLPTSYDGYEIEPFDYPGGQYLGVRRMVGISDGGITQMYQESLPKAYGIAAQNEALGEGMPRGLFYEYDNKNDQTDLAAVVPVSKAVTAVDDVQMIKVPASKGLMINYYGSYEGGEAPHLAMEKYMSARGLKVKHPVMEEYVTDPTTEPDTSKWLTKIFYLIE